MSSTVDIFRAWSEGRSPFFGEKWDAPATDHATQFPTPTDMSCYLCERKIEEGHQGWLRPMVTAEKDENGNNIAKLVACHRGCEMGTTIGHHFGYCSCTGFNDYWERGVALLAYLENPVWYLAVCQGCTPTLPMPFTTEQDRDDWARLHAEGTGHEVANETQNRVYDQTNTAYQNWKDKNDGRV